MSDKADPSLPPTMRFRFLGREFGISRFTFLLLLGGVVGALTGLVTVVFREAAMIGSEYIFPTHVDETGLHLFTAAAAKRLCMPMIGGLVCGALLFKLGKFTGSHSIPTILRAVASGRNQLSARMGIPPALAILTIVMGGSAGPEGPIAEIGSVTGSLIGRWARATPRMMKTLIGAGVAAGIAAMFNAPIAGVFFAIEVILRNYEVASFTPIVVAAVVGSVIANSTLGSAGMALKIPALVVPTRELPYYILLGLATGGISIFYIYGLDWFRNKFQRLQLPHWLKPAAGGLGVGIVGVFMPFAMGEGYEWIQRVVDGGVGYQRSAILLLVIMVLKVATTGMTLGSGNPGGSFAPAVFVGVMGGGALGCMLHQFGLVSNVTPFAVIGMAGLIAGALGAPITGLMIVLRFSGSSSIEILLALMTTVALCMFVMQFWRNVSVYTLEFVRLGIDLDQARGADPLSLVSVKTVMQTSGYEELPSKLAAHDALETMKESTARWFVVRDEHHRFLGIITMHEMRLAIAEDELAHLLVLADMTDAFQPRLAAEMSIKQALASFNAGDAEVLPVCDKAGADGKFIGVLSRQDALNAYSEYAASLA